MRWHLVRDPLQFEHRIFVYPLLRVGLRSALCADYSSWFDSNPQTDGPTVHLHESAVLSSIAIVGNKSGVEGPYAQLHV